MDFKSQFKSFVMNLRGWSTKRKLVVIESDDWGSVRMQSPEAFNFFKGKGYAVEECAYNRYDRLENNDDILTLLDTLTSFKDSRGNYAKFTLNNVVANPDFEKIEASSFEEYAYEPFIETYKRYPSHNKVMELYKEGIDLGCFSMQFHGREHVNVDNWLQHLRKGDDTALTAFSQHMFSVHRWSNFVQPRQEFLDTYGLGFENRVINHFGEVVEGLQLFKNIWGYNSLSMIAPTYAWGNEVEAAAHQEGVRAMQGFYVQFYPTAHTKSGYVTKRLYQGRKTSVGLTNLMRNAFFEPSINHKIDWVSKCMREIELAFAMNKPAVISSHRLNYMGGLIEKNRSHNASLLQALLKGLVRKYPDVEFLSSNQLASLCMA